VFRNSKEAKRDFSAALTLFAPVEMTCGRLVPHYKDCDRMITLRHKEKWKGAKSEKRGMVGIGLYLPL